MGTLIYKDFKSKNRNIHLIDKSYIDGCFTQIRCQFARAWKKDDFNELKKLKKDMSELCRVMEFYTKNIC